MKDINTIQDQLTDWIYDTFYKKSQFDLGHQYLHLNKEMIEEHIIDSVYTVTLFPKTRSILRTTVAQERVRFEFNEYMIRKLAPQLMETGKLTSRNRKFMPLAFMAFDIEGTRHNQFDTVTTIPHGHGAMMFHEQTMFHFRNANAVFLRDDLSFEIRNPTPGISLIKFQPIKEPSDLRRFIHYSLKYAVKLLSNETNSQPFDLYPPSSPNYPFWVSLQYDDDTGAEGDWRSLEYNYDLERLRTLADPAYRLRRRNRRGGSGAAPWHPTA